jgi:hypothetical protein
MIARLNKLLCGFTVMLVLLASITCVSAQALDNGVYTAKCSPHYRHPVTGKIEDSGGESSEVLGQSMTDGATYPLALIEVDPQGKMFATVRLKLMDNIERPTFMVQNRGDSRFSGVSFDIMKEDFTKNESDFRFEIPNENCIVRATFYVVPMGRDVVYYLDFSDLSEGSSDFVVSVDVKKTETETAPLQTEPAQTEAPKESTVTEKISEKETKQTEQTTSKSTTTTKAVTSVTESSSSEKKDDKPQTETAAVTTTAPVSSTVTETVTESVSDNTEIEEYTIPKTVQNGAKGVVFFDEKGTEIYPLADKDSSSEHEPTAEIKDESHENKGGNDLLLGAGIGAAAVIVIVGAVMIVRRRGK